MDRTQLAQIEAIDRNNAFEWGFFKAAKEAGLSKAEYEKMRKVAADSKYITGYPAAQDLPGGVKQVPGHPILGNAIVRAVSAPLRAIPKAIDMTADAVMGNPVAKAERARTIADRKLQAVQTGLGDAMDRGARPAVEDALRARMQAARNEYRNVQTVPPTVMEGASRVISRGLKGYIGEPERMPQTDVDDTNVEKANRAEAPANPEFQKQLQAAQQ